MTESGNKMDKFADLERQIAVFLKTEKEYSIVLESLEALATPGKAVPRHPKKEFNSRWKAIEDVKTKAGSRKAKSSILGDVHRRGTGPYLNKPNRTISAATDLPLTTETTSPPKPVPSKECPPKPSPSKECPLKPAPSKECPPKPAHSKECPRHLKKEIRQRWEAVEDVTTKRDSLKAKSSILGDGHKRRGPYAIYSSRKTVVTSDLKKEATIDPLRSLPKQEGSKTDKKPHPVHVSDQEKSNKRKRPSSPDTASKRWKPSKEFSRFEKIEKKVRRLTRALRKLTL
ncbi:uncharacterized protein LOC134252363 isoform X1 [Saccostrea cucullata]|uniref:uncharacterized protein LOC134252363 isoform X1 n=1 Tax=Saccostrea cuccullata TaxID=36930 RepID=UPI002ED55EDF